MKLWLSGFVVLFLCGCSTVNAVDKEYGQVNFSDGIDSHEAVVIAQKKFLESRYAKEYEARSAAILRDFFVRDYPGYWFVSLDSKNFNLTFWRYLVVIHKATGRIRFADPYVPLEVMNYDWVFIDSEKQENRKQKSEGGK